MIPPRTVILIPVFNHAGTVREVARKSLALGFPVLVVDDGSTDGSLDRVEDLPVLKLRLSENKGKGAAILAGAAEAERRGFEAVLTIDADGQHDPADASSLVALAASTWPAIVIGARRMAATENVPRSSLFGRDFSNFWVRLECGQRLPDTQSGYRLYPVGFLTGGRFHSRRYAFEVEAVVRAAWGGLPVLSTGVSVYYAPGDERISHFDKLRDNFRLSCLHTMLVLRSLLPWPHRRFLPRAAEAKSSGLLHPVQFFRRLSREHSSPGELATAVFTGIFIGSLPIIPFGIAAIVYAAHRLHLNKLAAVGASNLCVAPFVPLACIEVGYLLRYGRFWTDFNSRTLVNEIHLRLLEWLLGALVVGTLLGLLGAATTYLLVRALRRPGRVSPAP